MNVQRSFSTGGRRFASRPRFPKFSTPAAGKYIKYCPTYTSGKHRLLSAAVRDVEAAAEAPPFLRVDLQPLLVESERTALYALLDRRAG